MVPVCIGITVMPIYLGLFVFYNKATLVLNADAHQCVANFMSPMSFMY